MTERTSHSHPLAIATLGLGDDEAGAIGITFCPGKHQRFAATGSWRRDLSVDLDAIQSWGATTVITLVQPHELQELCVPDLGYAVRQRGLRWLHLPIDNYSIPDKRWETQWSLEAPALHAGLSAGDRVVLHCKGGLGRAGLVAARLLIERGHTPEEAITKVRSVRPGAIETSDQEQYLRRMSPPSSRP